MKSYIVGNELDRNKNERLQNRKLDKKKWGSKLRHGQDDEEKGYKFQEY